MKRRIFDKIILGSRWFLLPLYLGMIVSLLLFGIKFFQELWELFSHVTTNKESELILGVLSLIDLVLVANLMIMVIISGYETFIAPIIEEDEQSKPGWLGTLDPGTVKIKVAASLVGISSIHLLAAFLKIEDQTSEHLLWLVIMHMAFVISAILLAYIDRIAFGKHRDGE